MITMYVMFTYVKRRSLDFVFWFLLVFEAQQTASHWTDWYNDPGQRHGDVEKIDDIRYMYPNWLCDNPTAIDAVTLDGVPALSTGDVFRQFNASGLVCRNEDQKNGTCHDYKVRFCCPGSRGAKTCASEESLKRYPIVSSFSVNITEDIGPGMPIYDVAGFRSEDHFTNFSSVEIVYGNQFNRFGIDPIDERRYVVVAAYLSANITENFNLTLHAMETNGTVQAYGLLVFVNDVAHWPPFYNERCETPERPSTMQPYPWIIDVRLNGFDRWASEVGNPNTGSDFYGDINNSQCDITVYTPMSKKVNDLNLKDIFLQITDKANHQVQTIKVQNGMFFDFTGALRWTKHEFEWNYAPARPFMKRVSSKVSKELYQRFISEHVLVKFVLENYNTHQHPVFQVSVQDHRKNLIMAVQSAEIAFIGCPYGRFGAKCDKECMCKNGASCHVWNGACKCSPEWQGPACDIPTAPRLILSVVSGGVTVPLHGVIRLRCFITGIRSEIVKWEHYGADLLADDLKHARIETGAISSTRVLALSKATYGDSGNYRCVATGYGKEKKFTSNVVNISIEGCPVNTWGNNCTKKCNCVHASTCTLSTGCQCLKGWTGETCNRDTEKPSIKGCPSDITRFVSSSSDMVNVTWPPVTATDNDEVANMTSTHESGQLFPHGNSEVIISVFDNWNNSDECTFLVSIKDQWNGETGRQIIGIIAATCSVFVVFSIITIVRLRMKKSKPKWDGYCRLEIKDAQRRGKPLPGVKNFHRTQLEILNHLGQGQFSNVHRARLTLSRDNVTPVAVKILKDDIEYRPTFDQEIQLLQRLQDHANVIKLIGVVSEPSYCCTITELMRQDLLIYLKKSKSEDSKLTVKQLDRSLVTFALHVARALEYLNHQQVVHRDIAARNILISFDDVAKIADFGLSRDVYQKGQYQRHPMGGMLVPVRWMAPEALSPGVYSHKSDIWSYGVLLWEMATRGDIPYPEFQSLEPAFLARELTTGHRMLKPRHCTEDMYGLMRHCWKKDPEERPLASGLVNNILRFEKSNREMVFYVGQ
ncbi:uncharacterized protein [Ptychodera flava]|uniref:uncharacterized protein isoform X2 n=2 Tax=Ptychodera flava TaxID=63121 RepID=UPI00396A5B6B